MDNTVVFAFEPNVESALWLEECLGEQHGWNVDVIRQGLSDARDQVSLLIPDFAGECGAQATLHSDCRSTVQHIV